MNAGTVNGAAAGARSNGKIIRAIAIRTLQVSYGDGLLALVSLVGLWITKFSKGPQACCHFVFGSKHIGRRRTGGVTFTARCEHEHGAEERSDHSASAPEIISINSVVITAWRWRL